MVAIALAAFAGGVLGASMGALPSFVLCGFVVVAGEAANLAGRSAALTGGLGDPATTGAVGITANVGLGVVLGPHVAFGGGAAAAAYGARKGYLETNFDYHPA